MRTKKDKQGPFREKGAALIVGLIMLLLLTIIGLSAMQGTSMQEKMSGNMRDITVAFNGGETALRYVEEGFLKTMNTLDKGKAFSACTSSCQVVNSYQSDPAAQNALMSGAASWDTAAMAYGAVKDAGGTTIGIPTGSKIDHTGNPSGAVVAANPLLMVEYIVFKKDSFDQGLGDVDDRGTDLYRNTVKAAGGSPNAQAIVQTIFARRFK